MARFGASIRDGSIGKSSLCQYYSFDFSDNAFPIRKVLAAKLNQSPLKSVLPFSFYAVVYQNSPPEKGLC